MAKKWIVCKDTTDPEDFIFMFGGVDYHNDLKPKDLAWKIIGGGEWKVIDRVFYIWGTSSEFGQCDLLPLMCGINDNLSVWNLADTILFSYYNNVDFNNSSDWMKIPLLNGGEMFSTFQEKIDILCKKYLNVTDFKDLADLNHNLFVYDNDNEQPYTLIGWNDKTKNYIVEYNMCGKKIQTFISPYDIVVKP